MYIQRALEDTVRKASATFPVMLVTGPRQIGNSTMLERLAEPNRKIVTLDDPDIRYLAKSDPEPVTEPEKFGELSQIKMKIGNGAVVCMANDLLLSRLEQIQ